MRNADSKAKVGHRTRAPASDAPHAAACVVLRGAARVVGPGGETTLLERRDAALLAYLALEGPTSRSRVLELLWSEAEPETARNGLRQRLFKLKTRFGIDLARASQGGELLSLPDAIAVDVVAMLGDADGSATSPVTEPIPLLDAHAYADCPSFELWLQGCRERLSAQWRSRLAEQAQQAEHEGRLAQALVLAERLVLSHPGEEHAHRRLMRLHYLRGDRAAALAAFDRCERLLKDELSARPGAETLALLEVIEASGALASTSPRLPMPVALMRPPRLIGRAGTLRSFEAAWNEGKPFLLRGEAGMGKSRVLADFVATRPGGVTIVASRPGDGATPYAALARVLRALGEVDAAALDPAARDVMGHLLPEWATAPAARSAVIEPAKLLRHVESFVLAAIDGGLAGLIVDDLHFADAASVEMLAALCQAGRLQVMRFGFAQRPAEAQAAPEVWRLMRSEPGGPFDVALAPLNEAQVGELIDSLGIEGLRGAQWAVPLHQHAGGNPLFILETLKSILVDGRPALAHDRLPLPASIAGVIEARIKKLSAPALALARVAAIAGNDASIDMAAQLLQQRIVDLADPWAELEAAHIFKGEAFAHDLIFEAVLASVPPAIARRLHGEVAAWMEHHAGAPASRAEHWWAAGQARAAGRCWQQAAAAARTASRRAEEADFLERGAEAFRASDDLADEVDCLELLVVALASVDIGARLDQVIERALACPASGPQRLQLLLAVTFAESGRGRYERSVPLAREALQLAAELQRPAATYTAARCLAVGLTVIGSAQEALEILEQQRGWVEVHGTAENREEFAGDRGWVLVTLGRLAPARAAFEQGLAIASEIGHVSDMNSHLHLLAQTEARMGLCSIALTHCERALRLRDRLGAGVAMSTPAFMTAGVLCSRLGRYREALHYLTQALADFESAGSVRWARSARFMLAMLHCELGQHARAHQFAAPEFEEDGAAPSARAAELRAALADAQGSNPIAHHRQALALLGDQPASTLFNRREVALMGCARWSSPRAAMAAFDEIAADAQKWDQGGILVAALALRAQADPQPEAAADTARRALKLLAEFEPEGIYRAELWTVAATVFTRAGAHEEAESALRDGANWIDSTARLHVPPEFRDSFLNRNRVNVELRRAAARQRRLAR